MSQEINLLNEQWSKHNFTSPSKNTPDYQLHHSSIVSVITNIENNKNRSIQELQTLFDQQHDNGFIPGLVTFDTDPKDIINNDVWLESQNNSTNYLPFSASPFIVTAFKRWFKSVDNNEPMERYITNLDAFLSWWKYNRRCNNTSLLYTLHPWESFLPNSKIYTETLSKITHNVKETKCHNTIPLFQYDNDEYYNACVALLKEAKQTLTLGKTDSDDVYSFKMVNPLINSLYKKACDDLRYLYKQTGYDERANKWDFEAKRVEASLSVIMWDGDSNSFVAYDKVNKEKVIDEVTGYGTLIGKIPIHSRTNKIVKSINDNRSHSGHGCCIGSNHVISPLFNWLVIQGLDMYGKSKDADIMKKITIDVCDSKHVPYYTSGGEPIDDTDWIVTSCINSLIS